MNTLKLIFFTRFKIISILTVSMALTIILLMIRMKLTHSYFYLFLVWNLFLAIIPYAITTYLVSLPRLNKFALIAVFGIWMLFLPNAPYILTDFLHLRYSETYLMWIDVLLVTSFAYNGLILFFLSVMDMESVLSRYIAPKQIRYLLPSVFFLSSFGMYLGRFLRYNSWEIVQHPFSIFTDISEILINPSQHYIAWIFTLTFGTFLSVGYWMVKMFSNIRRT